MVLGLDTPLLTNIPLVLVSRRLLFFFLRRRAVCWFVLAVAPRWKSVCNNIREVLKTICWPRETERESNVDLLDRSFSEDWVMTALSEIVDGAFYNLKNALTLYSWFFRWVYVTKGIYCDSKSNSLSQIISEPICRTCINFVPHYFSNRGKPPMPTPKNKS